MKEPYKFENFRDQSFPVYSSCQQGNGTLVISHFHKAAELILVTAGTAAVYIHARRYICQPGDIIFIPPYSVHSVVCEGKCAGIRGLVFELSLIAEDVLGLSVEKILSKNVITDYIFSSESSIFPELNAALRQAADIYDRYLPTYKLEILCALYKITSLLVNHYFHSSTEYENYDRLQPVIDYINKNYQRSLSLSELSGLLNVCDDHLIRLFRSVTNKTPIRYIMDLRLQEAMKLLVDTNLSITAIAYATGFSSIHYMSRTFHACLGLTPSQYRKKAERKVLHPNDTLCR